jgi:hypothetical protein
MNPTNETLNLVAEARKTPNPEIVQRAYTQPTSATDGLIGYDLEIPSKKLYPVLTPLRNRIARRADGYSIQSNWRAVTGINTGSTFAGVSEGNRGGLISQTYADYFAKFCGLGLENNVTFEADMASKNFEDIKALAVLQLLQSLMIQEEFCDLGGNCTQPIGQATVAATADVATGGSLAFNTTFRVAVVPLTLQGWQQLMGSNNGGVGFSQSAALQQGLIQSLTRINADSTSDVINGGTGIPSAVATQATANDSNNTHCVSASVTPVTNAVGYAWYFGTGSNATMYLYGTSSLNSIVFTALPSSANQPFSALASTDNSANTLIYDGILTQVMKSGSGGYFIDLPTGTAGTGTVLTTDGAGGCTQINTAFASFYDNYRLSPDEMYMGSHVLMNLNAIIVANGGAPLIRYVMDENGTAQLDAGVVVASLLNKITNTKVKIVIHPNMPPGMILFWSNSVPYPLNNVGSIILKHLRRDYYQLEWPLRTRKWEYGCYFDGVLKCYFPPAYGVMRNIGG